MPQQSKGARTPVTVRFPDEDLELIHRLKTAQNMDRGTFIVSIVQDYLRSIDLDSLVPAQEALPIARAS